MSCLPFLSGVLFEKGVKGHQMEAGELVCKACCETSISGPAFYYFVISGLDLQSPSNPQINKKGHFNFYNN